MQTNHTIDPIPENDETLGDDVILEAEANEGLIDSLESLPKAGEETTTLPPALQAKEEPKFTADESQPLPTTEDLVIESKTRRFFRNLIRWAAGLLIVFGLGFLAAILLLYQPEIRKAEISRQALETELGQAKDQIAELKDQIASLQGQITSLQPLKDTNDELLTVQQGLNLHIAILDARLDVTSALLALADQDTARALVILDKTDETLDRIGEFLSPGQQNTVTTLKQRLELVLSEIETDPYAAQSDLDVLATNLLQLEAALVSE